MVRFDSDVGGFSTLDETAADLLKLAGHSGTIPSAYAAQDVAGALARVRAALAAQAGRDDTAENNEDDDESPVSPGARAFPFVELLEGALAHDSGVRWRASKS